VKTNRIILALVFLVLGFMVAFSFQMTNKEEQQFAMSDREWERNIKLHNELIAIEKKNIDLQVELSKKQQKLLEIEGNIAEDEENLDTLAKEAENLRMILGKVKVQGEGIAVSLADGKYNPENGNVNNYLVHEHQVLSVVNELYISGAEAVAINGKRLTSNSYIVCTGPVITVDGEQFPAPFVISAIGDSNTLEQALNIQGGVKEQLVNNNVIVKIEKLNHVVMDPIIGNSK
jgi:uncharacterized protein YlxW (UPF0749 family)